jgi:hypothetical protein
MNQATHWLALPEEGDSLIKFGNRNTFKEVAFSAL